MITQDQLADDTQAIHESIDSEKVVEFVKTGTLSKEVQKLIYNGALTGLFYDEDGEVKAQDVWGDIHTDVIREETAEELAQYIWDNVSLSPNDTITIWTSPHKDFVYTRGSMEYRDDEHKPIMTFMTMDEVPESLEDLQEMVEFQLTH